MSHLINHKPNKFLLAVFLNLHMLQLMETT